ncbi:MAG: glycosyltransferase family 4 protein [Candidatus Melainabacteria bacterium]|nr:glycosyltransferase family 4 protein [Candidatus Melainabacteria bacterium]
MQKPKIIVAHPGLQHSVKACNALYRSGLLLKFFTSHLRRKDFIKDLPSDVIVWNPSLSILDKIYNRLCDKLSVYKWAIWFDKWVSEELKKYNFDCFIGYETASLESFRVCKERGIYCVLDHAATHWKWQNNLFTKEEFLGNQVVDLSHKLISEVNARKEKELNLADLILSLSSYSKDTLLYGGVPDEKIRMVSLGVDIDKFISKEVYLQDKELKILFVGNIVPGKGIKYLLEAYLSLTLNNIKLKLVGHMNMNIKNILKKYKNIQYIPTVNVDKLVDLYHEADIFVFPSINDSFAQVVVEAMSCGLPVIVTENTGAKDAVRDGVDGFIIPASDVEAIKEKILYFYHNRNKIEEMGKNARKQAEVYNLEKYGENLVKVIIGALGSRK